MNIFKYNLDLNAGTVVSVSMPKDARVLSVGNQHEQLAVWAVASPGSLIETRKFLVLCTGEPYEGTVAKFLGTVQFDNGVFIVHVFEL